VRTDLFPTIAPIARFPKHVAGEEKEMRILWRKNHRLAPECSKIFRLYRHRQNILRLAGPAVEPRQFPADDDVRIERIGDDITVFLGGHWLPIAKRDLARVAAAFDSDRTAFLLATVKPIRKRVVRAHVIQLRGRLIIPGTPRLA